MEKMNARRWAVLGILGSLLVATLITAACDSSSSTTAGGGPAGQSVVTITGASQ